MSDTPDTPTGPAEIVADERADQLDAFDILLHAFLTGWLDSLAGRPVTAIADAWDAAVFEQLGGPFAEEAERTCLAVAAATEISPGTIRRDLVDTLAAAHLVGFARYGDHIAELATTAAAQAAPTEAAGFGSHTSAGALASTPTDATGPDPGPIRDASQAARLVLDEDRVLQVGGVVRTHMQNAATNLALHNGDSGPPLGRTSTEIGDGGLASAPADGHASKFDRTKVWQTMRDARVRPAHRTAQGQEVPTSAVFDIDGHWARYPGDPELPGYLRFGCRCFIIPGGHDADVWLARVRTKRGLVRFDDGVGELDGERLGGDGPLTASGGGRTLSPMTATYANAGPDHSSGIMVCVTPSPAECEALAMLEGCPVTELHCTLGYFGTTDEHPDEPGPPMYALGEVVGQAPSLRAMLEQACQLAAQSIDGPLVGEISGASVFTANPELPLIALPDVPGLSTLRETLMGEYCMAPLARDALYMNHGWCPHITIGYGATTDDLVAAIGVLTGLPVTFDAITLVYGEDVYSFPFGAAREDEPMRPTPAAPPALGVEPGMTTAPFTSTVGPIVYDTAAGTAAVFTPGGRGGGQPMPRAGGSGGSTVTRLVDAGWHVHDTCFAGDPTEDPSDPAADPAEVSPGIRTGDVVTITDDGAVGIVHEIITEGTAEGPTGPLEATDTDPLYILAICTIDSNGDPQPTGDTVAVLASMVEPWGDNPDQEDPADDEMATALDEPAPPVPVETIAPSGVGVMVVELDPRAGPLNRERAAARDFEWEGVLVVEGADTGDGRFIMPGALTARILPLTLMAMFQNPETDGHALALAAGSTWELERVGSAYGADICGRGFFDTGIAGRELRRMMAEGTIKGVSADLDLMMSEIWIDETTGMEKLVVAAARMMGATACNFPAFQEAVLYLVTVDAADVDPLVASGAFVWQCEDEWWTPKTGPSAILASGRGPRDLHWLDAGGDRRVAQFIGGVRV